MMHGCTEPSSTLHAYALAIAPHNITDPMGVNANARMTKSARKYHSQGNLLFGLPFMRVNILRRLRRFPFKYVSCFHSLSTGEHRSNTDYKPRCSRFLTRHAEAERRRVGTVTRMV